jgi:hypothetical protein
MGLFEFVLAGIGGWILVSIMVGSAFVLCRGRMEDDRAVAPLTKSPTTRGATRRVGQA